ncbi:MAG: KEOPS complex N(6)-L-threonylcarbamoyladenine synthase Kae1 [Nanoarchaeota archaeon]|nr:KEOPS complex N(6)-L-threonylcarbamoyladenine synthase Kae1 [Nanoarchaeota archaeon]
MKEICLGIESTAHTFGIGIVKGKNILANAIDMFKTKEGGMIPHEVAEHHRNVQNKVLEQALSDSKIKMKDIDIISFSQGPGLPPSLIAGMEFAKVLAEKYDKPLVGVNHICAHLEIGRMITGTKDPIFVFVSGANTQIIAHEGGKYRIFGETLDIGMGNAFDKFGRMAGLGFPAGPKIEDMAKKGDYLELPYIVKGMDVAFSGIITKAKALLDKGAKVESLCYSLQETCFAMLTEVTERAVAHCQKEEVILIGGVAANKRFCEMLNEMCNERGCCFYPVPLQYCGDQGAMIAWLGMLEFLYRKEKPKADEIDIEPKWRVDKVDTPWIKKA